MGDIKQKVRNQREFFNTGKTKDLSFRLSQLKKLKRAVLDNEEEILEALKKDLNKDAFDAYTTEIGMVLEEVNYLIKNLPKWVRKRRVRSSIANFLSRSYIYPEPYGVTLIMSPWNYPFQLSIAPLTGSIAAGNCAVVKPSAYSRHTSEVVRNLIRDNFDENYITVIEGGRETNTGLLKEKFDYIFFTGSVAVGKIVMEAASKHLTPVTLELGGKSPCIVDESAHLNLAAKRIVWGKYINAGQTCVAPDYLMVHTRVKNELIGKMKEVIRDFYGEDPLKNESFPKIINEKHYNRLLGLLNNDNVIQGGVGKGETLQIAPTLVDNVSWDSPLMEEEIFGPILPIMEFEDLDEVINQVNKRPKPLALYFFTTNKENEEKVLKHISFGGGCINDTIMHLVSPHMPFGGVGESGMGSYHGKASFDTFSHYKSVLKKSNLVEVPLRYPTHKNIDLVKRIMK